MRCRTNSANDGAEPATAQPKEVVETNTVDLAWHAQSGKEGTASSKATLDRTSDGVSVVVEAAELNAGHAYTMWWVVVDNPDACEKDPCGPADVLGNPDRVGQVAYAAGGTAPGDGTTTLRADLDAGDVPGGWFEGRTFTHPMGAEVHVILNDQGPVIEGMEAEMTSTYRGGCTDESLPEAFTDVAKQNGEPGPNACILWQSGVFQA